MRVNNCRYRQVIKDYFSGFFRGIHGDGIAIFISCVGIGIGVSGFRLEGTEKNWLVGLPVLFALISGAGHRVSLPFMMYLIPWSDAQREEYIQKMLHVKLAVPILFGILCDALAMVFQSVSFYAFVLQMISIFSIAFLLGILNDDSVNKMENRAAYGGLKDFAPVIVVSCYMEGPAMFLICLDAVSRTEFFVVLAVMVCILLPVTVAAGKRWKTIRRNFADYETVIKTEVR
ncbi:MAG: hypothetical protein NC300_12410 [Bacteroidales bacterium]|nr:hypothetical protein [Clostridium sp.]MCM1204936.1 hypothetical protein [Bacteroidales bacterium]